MTFCQSQIYVTYFVSYVVVDTVEIATPESDLYVTPGDAYHRTDHHCDANHCLTRQMDATRVL